jgi:hypothetical protein
LRKVIFFILFATEPRAWCKLSLNSTTELPSYKKTIVNKKSRKSANFIIAMNKGLGFFPKKYL